MPPLTTHILTSDDLKDYRAFLQSHPDASIHQTWEWGGFQTRMPGRSKFWVIAVKREKKIVGSMLLLRMSFPLGRSWLYSPRGPLLDYSDDSIVENLWKECAKLAKKEKSVFLRVEGPFRLSDSQKTAKMFKNSGFQNSPVSFQPECTLMVDLNSSEEEILKQMKQKGRYNIKVAGKHEVTVRESEHLEKDADAFYTLLVETTSRDGFSGHSKKVYRDMVECLNGDGKNEGLARLYLAEYQGKVVAGLIATFFKDTCIYYYGASGNQNRRVMAPYLLQWEVMKAAKAMGLEVYDFLGIAPDDSKKHTWAGVTQFKKKFGGEVVHYLPAQQKTYSWGWYGVYRLAKELQRFLKFIRVR